MKECVLISVCVHVSAFLILFYLSVHFIKLYKSYTIQAISLFHFLIPYRTEKKNLFSDTIWYYVNKGQRGWVNIIIRRQVINFGMKWRILYCIQTVLLNQIGPVYISFNWINVVFITACYFDTIFHNTQKQLFYNWIWEVENFESFTDYTALLSDVTEWHPCHSGSASKWLWQPRYSTLQSTPASPAVPASATSRAQLASTDLATRPLQTQNKCQRTSQHLTVQVTK